MSPPDFRKSNPQAFPVLNEKQIAVVAEFAERKTYANGDVLYRAGEKDFKFYVIRCGAIDIVDRSSGEPRLIVTLEPGEFTGDLANLTGRPSNIDAIATGTTEVYEICEPDLRRIIGKRPGLSDLILLTFITRAQALRDAEDFTGLRVIGTRFSGDAFRIRDFLTVRVALGKRRTGAGESTDYRQRGGLPKTSCAGAFAAGDVRCDSIKRVGSAVGEGAMAVQFVHEYLKELRNERVREAGSP